MEGNVGNSEQEQKEMAEKLYTFVLKQMKAGLDKSAISEQLVGMGMDRNIATELVEELCTQIVKVAKEEQPTLNSILSSLLGGVLAAVVGGVIWGLIVIATGYEIGYMAWGMGFICGFAVVLFSKGKKGIPLQVIAILSSVFGIIIGKYFTFFHYLKEAVTKEYGTEAAARISILSERVIQFFGENIGRMVSGFDVLWVILAVITAWRIPKGIGIKLRR